MTEKEEYCRQLLMNTKKLLDDNNIEFILDYGTLLGAYRDNQFIPYDSDIDISIRSTDYARVHKLLNKEELEKYNLLIVKGPWRGGDLNSLKLINFKGKLMSESLLRYRNEIYLDMYKINFNPKTIKYEFYGCFFNIPTETDKYLEHMYGKTWKTPIKGKHASWPSSAESIKKTEWFGNNTISPP